MTAVVLAIVGLFTAAGVASAAPGDPPPGYTAPGAITIIINTTIINIGGTIIIGGGGFNPGEGISITIIYGPPPIGLRSTGALRSAQIEEGFSAVAAASGTFSTSAVMTHVGTANITVRGAQSGRAATAKVIVTAAGSVDNGGGSTTTVVAPGTASGGTSTDGSALASTGASIAGPLTVGAAALIAGLGMLFFGTRLAIRRKARPTGN